MLSSCLFCKVMARSHVQVDCVLSPQQVCTGVMVHGYPLVKSLCGELQQFMTEHDFKSIEEFRGLSLPYFTTHTDLVRKLTPTQLCMSGKWAASLTAQSKCLLEHQRSNSHVHYVSLYRCMQCMYHDKYRMMSTQLHTFNFLDF